MGRPGQSLMMFYIYTQNRTKNYIHAYADGDVAHGGTYTKKGGAAAYAAAAPGTQRRVPGRTRSRRLWAARASSVVVVRRLRRISAADRTWMATEMRCAWNAVKERAAHDDSAASMESARPRAICRMCVADASKDLDLVELRVLRARRRVCKVL